MGQIFELISDFIKLQNIINFETFKGPEGKLNQSPGTPAPKIDLCNTDEKDITVITNSEDHLIEPN